MAIKDRGSEDSRNEFLLEGNIGFQQSEGEHQDLGIMVFAFDWLGEALGGGQLDGDGNFRMALRLTVLADIQFMASPGTDAMSVRRSGSGGRGGRCVFA